MRQRNVCKSCSLHHPTGTAALRVRPRTPRWHVPAAPPWGLALPLPLFGASPPSQGAMLARAAHHCRRLRGAVG